MAKGIYRLVCLLKKIKSQNFLCTSTNTHTCVHMHTPTPMHVVRRVFRLQTPAYTARKSHVTVMRQDLTNELLWEQQAKVVGTLLPSLSPLRSFTQPYLGNLHRPREGPGTCLPNEYKTKPLTDRWVTEVKCVHLLFLPFSFFFILSCLLPPYFFPFMAYSFTSAHRGTIQKRENGTRETKQSQSVGTFPPSFIPIWVVSLLTLSVSTKVHLGPNHIFLHYTRYEPFSLIILQQCLNLGLIKLIDKYKKVYLWLYLMPFNITPINFFQIV